MHCFSALFFKSGIICMLGLFLSSTVAQAALTTEQLMPKNWTNEGIRLGVFFVTLWLCCGLESWLPLRQWQGIRSKRLIHHLSLSLVSTTLVRALFPLLPVGVALWATNNQWGLLHQLAEQPLFITASSALGTWMIAIQAVVVLIILDALIYGQHVAFHHFAWLWKLHRTHHTDTTLDASTALRFHPLEIGLSTVLKMGAVALLGASAIDIMCFEIWLSSAAIFNHSNLRLPQTLNNLLQWWIVTPQMHRIHHDQAIALHNRNFGFALAWWDKLFGTYCHWEQPASTKNTPLPLSSIGLEGMKSEDNVFKLLIQPWK